MKSFLLVGTILLAATAAPFAAIPDSTGETHWHISGDLSEACTCAVPCACNFGGDPSPQHYCWALYSLDIQKGNYGSVDLGGLRLAGGEGEKAAVWYIDERATPTQAQALKVVAKRLAKDVEGAGLPVHYETAKIIQVVGDKSNRLEIGDAGKFEANYITGIDGKTPVVVENNWSWNIQHGIKGKTTTLKYRDQYGNAFDVKETNANQGKFDWTDQTSIYFR